MPLSHGGCGHRQCTAWERRRGWVRGREGGREGGREEARGKREEGREEELTLTWVALI